MRKTIHLFLVMIITFSVSCNSKKNLSNSKNLSNIGLQNEELVVPRRAEVLFLGHNSQHHDSQKYAPWLSIKLFKSGVNLTYTNNLSDLNKDNLSKYDGIVIYANHETIAPEQETALRDFVEGGKGLIALHSAAGCFKNSQWYLNTIGGQFAAHGEGDFTGKIVNSKHDVMKGILEFTTWDETYVHKNINPDITVLMERAEGGKMEPYTWVRNQGKGRVFYTAYGHEDKTWTNLGFLDLVRNGTLWAMGDLVSKQIHALKIPDVDIYNSDTISNYTKRYLVPKMQEALSPAESRKLTQVGVDFDIKLFASEPDIQNPIAMAWDERGRLWIVESVDYPNTFVETDGLANDRIKILEDTDGDGVADKFTVFADDLNIPTSIAFSNGGVLVTMAPDVIFLKDTDGDDVADVKEVVMSGWGKADTHAGPSNLIYGFDNKIWGVTGYSGFNGTVNGKRQQFSQGVYRFDPNGKNFEYLATSNNNTWGLGVTEDNNVFLSTANNTHSAFYSMPERLLQRKLSQLKDVPFIQAVQKIDGHYDLHALTPNLRQVDVVGGFTSATGHHFYTARNFPKAYWNRTAFVSDPTVRLIHNAVIEPDGAGFTEKDGWNLAASSDEWYGPVQVEVGPDGAVWVADWYNFIIQHNVFVPAQAPSDMVLPVGTKQPHGQGNAFTSPLRDINHGRIYRVVYKNAKENKPLNLNKSDLPGLLAALKNDNKFWRTTAQRLLVESQNKAAAPGLYEIINLKQVDEIGLNSPAVHALWTLHGLGLLDGSNKEALQVVATAMSHPAAGVRKAALQVMSKTNSSLDAIKKSQLMKDPDLNTRLAMFVSLTDFPAADEVGELIYQASLNKENEQDKWLSQALFAAAVKHEDGFRKAVKEESSFSKRILQSLEKEVYTLGRRNRLQFSPDISGKELLIKTAVTKNDNKAVEGVILAQGGHENGYALFIQEGKLVMQVNQQGKSYRAVSAGTLPTEKFDVAATLAQNGDIALKINGKQVGKSNAKGLFTNAGDFHYARSGEDSDHEAHKVGNYNGRFEFTGNIQQVSLELSKTKAKVEKAVVKTAKKIEPKKEVNKSITVVLKVVKDIMQYDKKLITLKAGQKVTLIFENPDGMPHNLLIAKPGSLQKVGAAADALLRNPKAAEMHYVPKIPEVLFASKLLSSGESDVIEFTVPQITGDYPFVCTFPGHWRGMNGIIRVVK